MDAMPRIMSVASESVATSSKVFARPHQRIGLLQLRQHRVAAGAVLGEGAELLGRHLGLFLLNVGENLVIARGRGLIGRLFPLLPADDGRRRHHDRNGQADDVETVFFPDVGKFVAAKILFDFAEDVAQINAPRKKRSSRKNRTVFRLGKRSGRRRKIARPGGDGKRGGLKRNDELVTGLT